MVDAERQLISRSSRFMLMIAKNAMPIDMTQGSDPEVAGNVGPTLLRIICPNVMAIMIAAIITKGNNARRLTSIPFAKQVAISTMSRKPLGAR
jgi:hypothetical protein